MMKYTLHIKLSSGYGAVIRALGLVERRGYSLNTCSVCEPDGNSRIMDITVSSSRSGDLLKRQLERLHDVINVELKTVEANKTHTPYIRPVFSSRSDLT